MSQSLLFQHHPAHINLPYSHCIPSSPLGSDEKKRGHSSGLSSRDLHCKEWLVNLQLSLIMERVTQRWGMSLSIASPERGLITSLPSRFAGNDSPSFVFPTAIATRQAPGGTSNRPPPPAKPGFLSSSTAGPGGGHLAQKRGTEDLDFFIGDEAIQANAGAGYGIDYPIKHGIISHWLLMER